MHKLVCYGTVMTRDGEVVKRAKFSNDPEGLEEFMEGLEALVTSGSSGVLWAVCPVVGRGVELLS